MSPISDQDLIARAVSVVNARRIGDYLVGDVGCALVSASGAVDTRVILGRDEVVTLADLLPH